MSFAFQDDTSYLQSLLDSGKIIPAGAYFVDGTIGLRPAAERILDLRGVVLAINPTESAYYRAVMIQGTDGVIVYGGTILGERFEHLGTAGEWGMGIEIRDSRRVRIVGTKIDDCWGDGIYIGDDSRDLTIQGVVCDENRRQGLTVTDATNVTIKDSEFVNTWGTLPACGIDIEPNIYEGAYNCTISNCRISGNQGGGTQAGPSHATVGLSFVSGLKIQGNTLTGNGYGAPPAYSVMIGNCQSTTVSSNTLSNNTGIGIGILKSSKTTVSNNSVSRSIATTNRSDSGLLFAEDTGTTCSSNRVLNNEGYGVFLWKSKAVLKNNLVLGNIKGNVGVDVP